MSSQTYTLEGFPEEGEALDALIRRARDGEAAAFEEILSRFEGKALSIAYHLGASRQDAEDVAQDAFLKLFRHIGAYRGGRRFTAYFYRIVVNAARDHLRRMGSGADAAANEGSRGLFRGEADGRSAQGRRDGTPAGPASEDPGLDVERRDQVRRALGMLSVREREVVILRDVHGLSTWEVSRILRVNPITVRRHSMRARARLRDLLRR